MGVNARRHFPNLNFYKLQHRYPCIFLVCSFDMNRSGPLNSIPTELAGATKAFLRYLRDRGGAGWGRVVRVLKGGWGGGRLTDGGPASSRLSGPSCTTCRFTCDTFAFATSAFYWKGLRDAEQGSVLQNQQITRVIHGYLPGRPTHPTPSRFSSNSSPNCAEPDLVTKCRFRSKCFRASDPLHCFLSKTTNSVDQFVLLLCTGLR